MPLTYKIAPSGKIEGCIQLPGDKSISHRAIILGSIAEGVTEIDGFLPSLDCLATLNAFASMGVTYQRLSDNCLRIHGVGLKGLTKPPNPCNLGNSGTAIRLLTGVLAGQNFSSILTGDQSLLKRPMQRIVNPLQKMGARITAVDDEYPPLHITGNQKLSAIEYTTPKASAQVKSSLILAALYANGVSTIIEPKQTRDHIVRMLKLFGANIRYKKKVVIVEGKTNLQGTSIDIPGDISSAAFFIVAATIAPGSNLIIKNVGINPTRLGLIHILHAMGANITVLNTKVISNEPVADLHIRSSTLHGIEIPKKLIPLAIDEFPVIFVAASCAKGKTILRGAAELRVKESDRIHIMTKVLGTLGINVTEYPDGLAIEGGQIQGGHVNSHGDHRIAMACAVAALAAKEAITINDCHCVATSFPNFTSIAQQSGLKIKSFISRG